LQQPDAQSYPLASHPLHKPNYGLSLESSSVSMQHSLVNFNLTDWCPYN
jgi:hypothetical protein